MALILLLMAAVASVSGQPGWHGHQYTDPTVFASWLTHIQHSVEFTNMSLTDQLLFGELVMAAEQGTSELTALIDRYSFEKVMILADELSDTDRNHFQKYLTAHLPKSTVKRDMFSTLNELHLIHDITHSLPPHEREVFFEMLTAAKTDSIAEYINQKGYGTVLRLLTYVKGYLGHELDHLVIEQLHKESLAHQTTTVVPLLTTQAQSSSL